MRGVRGNISFQKNVCIGLLVVLAGGCALSPQPFSLSELEAESSKRLNSYLST